MLKETEQNRSGGLLGLPDVLVSSSTVLTPGSLLRCAAGILPGPSSGACPPHSVLSPCISAPLLTLGKFFLWKDGYCHLPLHAQKYTPSLAFRSSISPWVYEQVGQRRWTQNVRFIYFFGRVARGILIPDQESTPTPAWNLNHWTARWVPQIVSFTLGFLFSVVLF